MASNLLDSLLDLEEDFYKEGYDLGISDGAHAGYTEGTVFAVEKGFEKFVEMGRLYGKGLVWTQRLASLNASNASKYPTLEDEVTLEPIACKEMLDLPPSSRLTKNIDILLELVDPASLVMKNTEEAVTDVDERLKGATTKTKLIQRALGEGEDSLEIRPDTKDLQISGDGSGSIEDISSLNIRGH